jgi:hypothetical protein
MIGCGNDDECLWFSGCLWLLMLIAKNRALLQVGGGVVDGDNS